MSPSGDSEIVNEARVVALMQTFATSFRSTAPEVFREFGREKSQEFIDELKFKIASQLFGHVALSRQYYLGKIRAHQDPRILIQTGEYLNGMVVEEIEGDTSGIAFRCGMRSGIHQSSGLSIKLLQRFLEFGTMRHGEVQMPARPHWRPQMAVYRAKSPDLGRELRSRLASRVHQNMQG